MNFAPYIPLAGCICNIVFALFVFSRGPRARPNRVYLLLGLSIATWNLGSYFLFVVRDSGDALFWARVLHLGVIYGIAAFVHLSLLVAGYAAPRAIVCLYTFQTLLALLDMTPWFIESTRFRGAAGWYAVSAPGYHLLSIPYSLSFASIIVLLRRRMSLPAMQRRRLTPLITAQSLLALLGINDILPIIGIEFYPMTQVQVYPYGSLAAVFFGIISAYSVLQHQLLDIQVGLSRIVAHVIRFTFLFSIALGLLLAYAIFVGGFTPKSFFGALVVLMASAIIASLLFPKVFGGTGLEKWERRILGDRFEYHDQVRQFIESTSWYSDLATLFDDLHELLTATFRLSGYQIILREETSHAFSLHRSHPEQVQKHLRELRVPSEVLHLFERGEAEYIALSHKPGQGVLAGPGAEQLAAFNAEFCFPLSSQNEPFGLLLIGKKEGDAPYTATDINLLVALVKSMSLVINQIRLKTQILQAEELDLLGRMSRGMAHDLNNLLTPISTFLQLSCEGLPPQAMEELLPVALRNIKAIRAYIKESLFFSENLRPDIQVSRLDVLITRAAEVARNSRSKIVNIETSCPGEVLMEMDEVLMQRLIANLISNAIDASSVDAHVRVELTRLITKDFGRDWLRIRIVDEGEGIRKEDLNRVFTPYFTTKDRGDEGRGFGLGLAICRKIVNLHGGNLSIASQLKKGTTVQVDLPSRQVRQASPPVAA